MQRLISHIKIFLSVCITILALSCMPQSQSQDAVFTDTIPKEIITHKIVSEELRNIILEYDTKYSHFVGLLQNENYPLLCINISCVIRNNSIEYIVCYNVDIGNKVGMIVCEPINGKEVLIDMCDLRNQIELPKERSVELLKHSNLKQYDFHKSRQKEIEGDPEASDYGYVIFNDFVEWGIVFAKHTGECLGKYTPDMTEEYQAEHDAFQKYMTEEFYKEQTKQRQNNTTFLQPLPPQLQSRDMVYTDTIQKEIITHKIMNDELKNFILEYDKKHSQYVDNGSSKGINITCDVHNNSIKYYVGYMDDIWNHTGVIVCEPINNKEIYIDMSNLRKQIVLPKKRSIELLKNSNLKQYEYHKYLLQKEIENNRETDDYEYDIIMTGDFVHWEIVFDKRTGKCLWKYTPDKTGFYQKWQEQNRMEN